MDGPLTDNAFSIQRNDSHLLTVPFADHDVMPIEGPLADAEEWRVESGAGEGNRTLVVSLGSSCSAIELHPHITVKNP